MSILTCPRRYFIGGSDARIIMGDDEAALLRLWREKRGEIEPEDLLGNLIVQLGLVTEGLNRRWYHVSNIETPSDSGMKADAAAVEFARCFLRLANLPNFALDHLSRYESTLWRQAGRVLYALEILDRRKPQERTRRVWSGAETYIDRE